MILIPCLGFITCTGIWIQAALGYSFPIPIQNIPLCWLYSFNVWKLLKILLFITPPHVSPLLGQMLNFLVRQLPSLKALAIMRPKFILRNQGELCCLIQMSSNTLTFLGLWALSVSNYGFILSCQINSIV